MPKKEYSVGLTKLLKILKTNKNPTQLQNRRFKELNQEEREIYMKASKKQPKADDAPSNDEPSDDTPSDIEITSR